MTVANPDFLVKFDTKECDQFDHIQRHSFETGTDQSQLAAEDQTTAAALAKVLSELQSYYQTFYPTMSINKRSLPPATMPSSSRTQVQQNFLAALLQALEAPKAQLRLNQLTQVGKSNGLLPLPGYGGVSLAEWELQADTARCTAACATTDTGFR